MGNPCIRVEGEYGKRYEWSTLSHKNLKGYTMKG